MPVAFFYAHFAASPHFNMAFDEWLLAEAMARPGSLFLRLYSWRPGTITFGYNQRQESALDWSRVGETPVIRRVTGGRALFHDPSELTYSIAVNTKDPGSPKLAGSLSAVSAELARALGHFLEAQGIQASYERQSSPENALPAFFHKAPCFASSAKYELKAGGRKVVASAQKRLGDALLQHGSIKVAGLAKHPALDMDSQDDNLEPLTESLFGQQAELFRQEMGKGLGVEFAPAACEERWDAGLRERLEMVSAMPLGRREFIKQSV